MTTLKVSSPAELISAVPYLIGFHPADSLTIVAMDGRRITFAVRIDLPELSAPAEEARAAVLHLASVVVQQEAQAVTIIGYGEQARVTPAVLRIAEAFRKVGLPVIDELRVADGRYWSYMCTDLSCCSAQGRPCDPPDSVVAAEATFAGAVALPNREALAAQLAPAAGDDRDAMIAATARAVSRLTALAGKESRQPGTAADDPTGEASHPNPAGLSPEAPNPDALSAEAPRDASSPEAGSPETPSRDALSPDALSAAMLRLDGDGSSVAPEQTRFLRLVRRAGREAVRSAERCYRAGRRLTDDEAAWLGLLLVHTPIRDYAWTRTRTQEWELALWSDMVRRVELVYTPAPASLLAFVAWRMGSGALASIAVERALDQQEDYSLAVMLHKALVIGMPPSVVEGWPAMMGAPAAPDRPEPRPASRRQPDPRSEPGAGSEPGPRSEPESGEPAEPGPRSNACTRSEAVTPTEHRRASAEGRTRREQRGRNPRCTSRRRI